MNDETTTREQPTDDQITEMAREEAIAETHAVSQVVDQITQTLPEVIHLIESADGKVLITGGGTSSAIARRMAHLLSVTGTPALFVHSMDALHGTMGAIEPRDVLIAISKGGESDEINQLVGLVREKGTKIVGIGEHPESTLASLSDVYVDLLTVEGGDPGNALAMGSTLVTAVWGDALARTLMHLNGWKIKDSVNLHPAGYVGKKAEEILSVSGEEG